MARKHLKRLRTEKAKVQLKKKALPKGKNVTDTTFKVKKILTVEQLKKVDKDEPVSHWNLPLKELLIRLNHYNLTSRLNALNGIRELLTNYPAILRGPSLKLLIGRILVLLNDDEHKIRITTNEILDYIFSSLATTSVIPFYDILNVHLNCAMTHRNISVQQDSLKFMDVLIKLVPDSLKNNFKFLTQNFIRIIKAKLCGSHLSLKLNGSQQDLEKSRIETFYRLYQFLSITYSNKEEVMQSDSRTVKISYIKNLCKSLGGAYDQYKEIPSLPSVFTKAESGREMIIKFDSAEFKSQCSCIIPLLFDTWIEVSPKQTSNGLTSEILSEGSAVLLYIITRILLLLYEAILKYGDSYLECWFQSSYAASFKKCFLSSFPYVPPVSPKTLKWNISDEFSYSATSGYIKQNLNICYLSYIFKITLKNVEVESKMEEYISNALSNGTPSTSTEIDILSKIVEKVINSSKRKKADFFLNTLIKVHQAPISSEFRRRLSEILIKIILQNNEVIQENQSLLQWMVCLPNQLCKTQIPVSVVEAILEVIKRPAGVEVLKRIENKAVEILENLPKININGIDPFEGQKLIINILYWCDNAILEELVKKVVVNKDSYSQMLRNYIISVFSYKLKYHIIRL